MTYLSLTEYTAKKVHANERLSQELTRIRNLPKRSLIAVGNKYGLKHASQKNSGLVKSLELNLNSIDREEKRVQQYLSKKRRTFTECTMRSFPALLPSIIGENAHLMQLLDPKMEVNEVRPIATFNRTLNLKARMVNAEVKKQAEVILNYKANMAEKQKKDMLRILKKHSKERMQKVIENNQQMLKCSFKSRCKDAGANFLAPRTKCRMQKQHYKSCFPLLTQSLTEQKENSFFNAETHLKGDGRKRDGKLISRHEILK